MSHRSCVVFMGTSLSRSCNFLLSFIFCLSIFSVEAQVTLTNTEGTPAGTGKLLSIAYGNGVYIAVGSNGTMVRSTDGQHFQLFSSSNCECNGGYWQVVFANGLFLVIGDGTTLTSTDGFTWSGGSLPVRNDNSVVTYFQGLLYAGGQWMAVLSNHILTSPDAITWTVQTTGYPGIANFVSLVYKDGNYILGGTDGIYGHSYIIYSSTGIGNSWSEVVISDTLNNDGLTSLHLLNNTLYAFTRGGISYMSTDINHWTLITDPRLSRAPHSTVYTNSIEGGLYSNGTYYIYGSHIIDANFDGQEDVYTSQDQVTWTSKPQNMTNLDGSISYVNGYFYRFNGDCTAWSTDAATWTIVDGAYHAVATNGNLVVAVGNTGGLQDGIFTSADGSGPWTDKTVYRAAPLNAVTYGNGKFVAIGNQDTTNKVGNFATSIDGTNWTAGYAPIQYNMRAIAYGNGKFVAVGEGGEIDYSTDGNNWTKGNTELGSDLFAISFVNGFFIAAGGGPFPGSRVRVIYSRDGIIWTDVSPDLVANAWGIAYGNGKYVLVGGANVQIGNYDTTTFWSMTTTDITNASAWSVPSFSVNPFLPTLASLGSVTPSADYPYVAPLFSALAYGDGQFVTVSELAPPAFSQSYVLSSSDGVSWAATSVPGNTGLHGIIYTGSNTFLAVGTGAAVVKIMAGTPLPLTLVSFTGLQAGDKNILSWQTSDEVNTKAFVLEWSHDGYTYSPIDTVPAAGRSNGRPGYSYTHEPAPVGHDLYRLRMIDLDGNFTYSNIVSLTVSGNQAPLALWPNPVTGGTVNIAASSTTLLPVSCTVYDANGKMVQQVLLTAFTQMVDVSGLSKGVYTLKFSNGAVKRLVRL